VVAFVTTDKSGVTDSFDTFVTQDSQGNLSFTADDGTPITFTRLGTGRTIAYRISVVLDATPCDVDLSGTAQLNTTTNAGKGHVSGVIDTCSRYSAVVTFTKK
jgi:hypothetical protein